MKPLERVSRTEKIVNSLKEYIVSGEFKIGDKFLTEMEICKQLNVGRSTVREALRVLQTMGYIELRPGRGAFVLKTREDEIGNIVNWFTEHGVEIMDFMEVRMSIEILAVKLAAERRTEEHLKEIEELYSEFEWEIKGKKDAVKLALLDEVFHNSIARASNNKLLISISEKIARAFGDYRRMAFSVTENAIHALEPHKEIMEGIKERDVKKAENAMIRHLEISLEDIKKVMEMNS